MNNTEFFTLEHQMWFRLADGTVGQLKEDDRKIVVWMFEHIELFYPKALAELKGKYKKSQTFITLFQFKVVDHFCRCNFGGDDGRKDISSNGKFRLENVKCPLKGICKDEGVICGAEFNSSISAAELRVLEPLFRGKTKEDIVDSLCLAMHTINNHIRNAYVRIGVHRTADFMRYAHEHQLFKED